jgi:hypothetical protein
MKRVLLGAAALLWAVPALAQVQQSGTVTARHPAYWVTSGAIGDPGGATDSALSSLGVTNEGGPGLCVSSQRASAAGRQQLCLSTGTSTGATITLSNLGTAPSAPLSFVIDGTTYPFPGSLANITIGVTPVVGGSTSQCLFVSGGVVGQQACTLSAITSLTGDGTATGPGISALTLATVNSNVGTFGSGAVVPIITVNGKGLITSVSTSPVSIAIGSSAIMSGSNNGIIYDNGGVFGNLVTLSNAVLVTSVGGVPSMTTTLPSGLTIPSPTFTGTETFPDAATWTSTGISKVAALSVGSATLPSGGNISISAQYLINGTQISASTALSDGKTGTGNLVGVAGPSGLSGTWAGSITLSGNNTYSGNSTFSGQDINTGTSPPASAGGQVYIMGTIAAPTLTNTGQGAVYDTVVGGLNVQGDGSTSDFTLRNAAAGAVFTVPTGTTKLNFPSLSSGTCSSGLGLDSGSNTILVSCPGAAASIQSGTTTVTGSPTNGNCLYVLTGVLANRPCLSEPQGRITLTANTPVMTATASAQTTLRYDCYIGGQVPYYDGTQDNIDTIASCEVTDAMVSAASAGQVVSSQVYDVWWVHGGANRICIAMSSSSGGGGGWASDTGSPSNTARGTGYSQLDRTTRPYTTNKNAITNCFNGATNYGSVSANQATYLGTVYASANGQISWTYGALASGGTAGLFGVWNMYNRVVVESMTADSTSAWNYATTTIRAADNSSTIRHSYVIGIAEDTQTGFYNALAVGTVGVVGAVAGVCHDVTNAFSGSPGVSANSGTAAVSSRFATQDLGFHFMSACEVPSAASSVTYNGTNGNAQSGMFFNSRM